MGISSTGEGEIVFLAPVPRISELDEFTRSQSFRNATVAWVRTPTSLRDSHQELLGLDHDITAPSTQQSTFASLQRSWAIRLGYKKLIQV